MADFDDWGTEGDGSNEVVGGADRGDRQIQGGLLDPRTFPTRWDPLTDYPSIEPQAPQITGPLKTDIHAEVLQDVLNAQAGLRPAKPHPETWSVGGRPYLAVSAENFDPARSNGVTSMETPGQDAAAWTGRSQVLDPRGLQEFVGYISNMPVGPTAADIDPRTGWVTSVHVRPTVLRVPGATPGTTDGAYTSGFRRPDDISPYIHSHPDNAPDGDGMVDDPGSNGGYGDTQSLSGSHPVPMATLSHGQVGWHVLDDGQLKFLYPAGSMTPSQIGEMRQNLNKEQKKLLRSK